MSNQSQQYSEEVKKLTYEKTANVKYQLLQYINDIINLASSRGAFKGEELSYVGAIFDSIKNGIDKGFEITKQDVDKVSTKEEKLEIIQEEPEST